MSKDTTNQTENEFVKPNNSPSTLNPISKTLIHDKTSENK